MTLFSKVVCTGKGGLILAFLLFSKISFAQMPMLSIGIAGTSIGSDKGVSLQFRSPLIFNSVEKMRGFGLHLNLNQMKAFSYDYGYTLITVGASVLLHEIHAFRFFFTSSGNYFVGGNEVSGAGGLLYTLSSEWEFAKKWSLNLEAGYSLSFASINIDPRPYQVDFQKIANGFSLILGTKFHI